MTAVQIAYSRTRAVFGGIITASLLIAGFFLILFSTSRIPGISEVSGVEIAHADAPYDPYNPNCGDAYIPPDYYMYQDPCGCGCGCGF